MTEGGISYALKDGVARIAFDDPARMNAVSEAVGMRLLEALRRAEREAGAVLLTGEGKAFCSGADLGAALEMVDDPDPDGGLQLERTFNPVIEQMRTMPQPVVTAVPGVAAGIGCGIALAGDIILCGQSAYFFFAFASIGLVPDGGCSWMLSRAIGRARAMRLMLLGEKLPAAQALEWGLISAVASDCELPAEAARICAGLAKAPPAIVMTKRLAWAGLESDLAQALRSERQAQRDASRTEEFARRVRSFAKS